MNESILIRNAFYVSSKEIQQGDVFIKNGKIKEIGVSLNYNAQEVIDAEGLFLLPGVIDAHVHFREPGMEWKENIETGSKAAVSGGVTSILDMPNTIPMTIDKSTLADKKRRAAMKSLANYNFFIGATQDNQEELAIADNVCGIKIFMGSSTGSLLVDRFEDWERIFAHGKKLIAVHAESQDIILQQKKLYSQENAGFELHMLLRPPNAALEATKSAVRLAQKYQRRLHILHVSTQEEVEYLKILPKDGLITGEVCPQHLFLSGPDIYQRSGGFAQVNPPIREERHGKALWEALKTGVVDFMASDHAPHTINEKKQPFGKAPSGIPGTETLLPLLLNRVSQGHCSLQDVVKWLCEKPAEAYGMVDKGYIRNQYDADLVLVDMKKIRKVENDKQYTLAQWSLFDGWEITGWPLLTIVNGNIVFREGDFITTEKGKEIKIAPPWE